ncbi:MAG TPA: hypothetical protein PKI11_12530 [Candidatus Hydrogenedentes bacterium]|nr:hypothetical protein [Candidatus Hydrogenedentota bacterium]
MWSCLRVMGIRALLAGACVFLAQGGAAAAPEPGLVINEDDSHFFGSRSADQMSIEGLNAFVDQYAGTKVSHLFLCPNAMKASFRSKVWDAIWDLKGTQKPPQEDFAKTWCENARLLDERGLDPYAVWIARCREKRISPWLSMRMNDVHNVDDVDCYIHNSFWRDHPEYWRVPGSAGSWVDRAFDYGIPEVREHHMAFVRELLERYDPDGLELDWMRFGYHFKPGHEAEGSEILTQFMKDVRALTNEWSARRGHAIRLGARVPAHPDAAIGLGMDGIRWVRDGLVDMLVPTPFWATSDFDIPIELWRERLGDTARNIVLAAGQEILLRAYPGANAMENDLLSVRGFAAAHLHRGVDQIYLFNYMDAEPMQGGPGTYRALLENGLALADVVALPRRFVVTYRDTVPPGMSNNAALPVDGFTGGTFRVYIGPAPKTGTAAFIAGLARKDGVSNAAFEVTVNGRDCPPAADLAPSQALPDVARAVSFACPLEVLEEGYNTVQIKQTGPDAEQQIVWAEIRIQ